MAEIVGRRMWDGGQDDQGYRTFKIVWRIRTSFTEGPNAVLDCPGLPVPGSPWSFDDDFNLSVWCLPKMGVKPIVSVEGDPCNLWDLEQSFSNKPPPASQQQGCQDQSIDDPLLQPQKVSGSFVKYQEEATYDRFGEPIDTSSFEQIRGAQNEWDANRPSVVVEQNVATLGIEVFAPMIDSLNMFALWGVPARYVKLSDAKWEKKFYGLCYVYYTRTFTFDINYRGFDRDFLDEGTKVLHGHWGGEGQWVLDEIDGQTPDYLNPSHYDRFKDKNGENCKVILNGFGIPSGVEYGTSEGTTSDSGAPGSIHVEKYFEADFLLLGIPTTL